MHHRTRAVLLIACCLGLAGIRDAGAVPANAFHIPDDSGEQLNPGQTGTHMRDPESEISTYTTTTVTIYSGVQKYNNSFGGTGIANQTGGTLYYKSASQGTWSSTGLAFANNSTINTNNQYWKASFDTAAFAPGDVIQYYLYLTFDGVNGVQNTYLYGNNAGSSTTATQGTAAAAPFTITPLLTVNGVNADYTATHLFVNEVSGDSIPLTILFSPGVANVTNAEAFSNLNRRDRATNDANGDGIEDGIVPPDGNQIFAGDDNNYYKAYTMTPTGTPGQYSVVLNAQKTGAYRLTARYQVLGSTNFNWYTTDGRRDHAIVVSPTKARGMVMYELDALNIDSQGTQSDQRSTFTDLYNGPGSRPYDAVTNRFNLNYANNLGVNWLWIQPIHPIGIDGREVNTNTAMPWQPYSVGSPYSVKNFFEVSELLSKASNRPAAMVEFQGFVAAADAAGVNVMLDEPFNHTSYDCELANSGVYYWGGAGNPGNWQPTDEIRDREARVYSLTNNYCSRAFNASSIAVAPDRGDFGKFDDTHDVFFGEYSALVCQNPQDNGNYLSTADIFDYTTNTGNFDYITQNTWRYFADSILFWLDQTGCTNGTPAAQTAVGIDGIRADFGQGLPPQCWEYIINKTRSRKWDFVFMTESLDGGAVTYRSNRHFDVLNENAVFAFQTAATASDYRNIFESRRTTYGQSIVLWNSSSHDEENFADPFEALIRYLVGGTIDGTPMIFYGQELGISQTFGFDEYELNFGKLIPQFKEFNSLQPVCSPANRNYGLDQLYPVFSAVGQARQFSAALRSSNRYYLDQTGGGGPQANIFSVAKYETANASPNLTDVVLAFVNLDRNNTQQGNFNVNITQNGSNLFGIQPGRIYNVKNISAYLGVDPNRRNYWLWPTNGPGGTAGSNVLANGIFVALNPVPTNNAAWSSAPFEAQYLKLYDVTPPPAPSAPSTAKPYAIGNAALFTWPAVVDPNGGVSGYHVLVGTTPGASNVFNGIVSGTSVSVTNVYGQTLYASVSAINNAGIEGAMSGVSSGTILLDPNGDYDGDGMSNAAEDIAGTNPLDANSLLRIVSLANGASVLTWTSVAGRSYQVLAATNLSSGFTPLGGQILAAGATASYTNSAIGAARYYRVQVLP